MKRARALVCAAASIVAACGGGTSPARAPESSASQEHPENTTRGAASVAPTAAAAHAAPNAGTDTRGPETNDRTPTESSATTGTPNVKATSADLPKKIGARHVLVQWMGSERAPASVVRTKEQARVVAEEVLRRARAGEDLGRLAVEYSDEPNAGGRGGSLGRFGRGQMVGAFEEAAFKLKVGEVSNIVETPFGFHVIQRTD